MILGVEPRPSRFAGARFCHLAISSNKIPRRDKNQRRGLERKVVDTQRGVGASKGSRTLVLSLEN